MKRDRLLRSVSILVLIPAALAFTACAEDEDPRLSFLTATEPVPYEGVAVTEDRIAELRANIREYEDEVDLLKQRYGEIASFHKLLAHELIRQEMYGPALESVQAALELQPGNAILYYFGGVAAAQSARAHMLDGGDTVYLERAEDLFRKALDLRPEYKDALFAMAVLLSFDLDRPAEALEYSGRLSAIETGDPSVKFLHANVLVRNGELAAAIEVYDELVRSAPGKDQRDRARANRDELERRGGGS